MTVVYRLVRWVERASDVAGNISQVFLWIMFSLMTVDIFLRFVFNKPITGVFEIVQLCTVALIAFTMAYAQRTKQHIFVDLLFEHFPARLKYAMHALSYSIALAFFGMLTWQCGLWSIQAWKVKEKAAGMIDVPMWAVKIVVTLAAATLCVILIIDIVRCLRGLIRPPAEAKIEAPESIA